MVSVDEHHERAVERFEASQVFAHLASLGDSTMKGRLSDSLTQRNLVGTPDEVLGRIEDYRQAGVQTFAGLLFATDTVEETHEAMEQFADLIMDRLA